MEEITIRFEIVRLAAKMADHDTIGVQSRKLRDLSLDQDLNEIIVLLEGRNYRQALFLMKSYISSLDDSFFNTPISRNTPSATNISEKQIAQEPTPETQNLFDIIKPQASQTINLDDMLRMTEESAEDTIEHSKPEFAPDRYLSQAKEEVKKNEDYLDINKNSIENKTIKPFEKLKDEVLTDIRIETCEQNEYGDTSENVSVESVEEISEPMIEVENSVETDMDEVLHDKEFSSENEVANKPENRECAVRDKESNSSGKSPSITDADTSEATETAVGEIEITPEELSLSPQAKEIVATSMMTKKIATSKDDTEEIAGEKVLKIKRKEDCSKDNRQYPPISYIDQKFRNMRHQFPQIEQTDLEIIEEVRVLLKQIATQGYTENDIKDAILLFKKKKDAGNIADAAQILLLAAASESKYAQLLLARELFRGEVLKVDYPEAFTQINRLAEHDYPEAICDLAQLYEYGYGIKKDRRTAQLLYDEATEMGVERAQKHADRLGRKKGILSSFFK